MKSTLNWLRLSFLILAFGSLVLGCSSSDSGPTDNGAGASGASNGGASGNGAAGRSGSAGTAGTAAGSAGAAGVAGTGTAGAGGAAGAAGAGGAAGTAGMGGAPTGPFVYFVKQANGTNTAALASGTISVSNTFGASGNAFKYVAPNYYGTVSNGFIAFPTTMSADFSITAEVTITAQNKANNACGIGLGLTTGFAGSDSYAYELMRNANNSTNGYYVNGAGTVSAGTPTVAFTNGTPLQLSFSRTGTSFTYGAGPVGAALTTTTSATSNFSNGTTVYGTGPVYPAISFNNVNATITKLVIKDGTGATVFDSATGALVEYVPASLTVSASAVSVTKGASTTVTATALAAGGAVSAVTAVSADPTIASVALSMGAADSSLKVSGLKGGVTTITVTNTSDTNATTNTKTITVSVDDFPATDGYGPLTTRAYPAPAATTAYTDGELALTFDSPPTLNTGGSIKIYKLADGTQVDSVGFAGETQTFGTTTLNVAGQLARVAGNTLYFTPHLGKLAYGAGYYVVIPTTSVTGTLNAVAFNGLSNLNNVATWKFTTRAAPTLTASNVTVDGSQTSTANFRTIQGALGAIAGSLPAASAVTINVAAGTYRELLHYTGPGAATPITVTIAGPAGNNRGDTCVVQYSNGNGLNGSTQGRPSAYLSGASFVLQNITLKNTAVRSALAQAEALYFASGTGFTLAAYNSSFYSNQDTIQTSGRSWFYKCFVEGNVDFIWGTGDAALFENSSLHFLNETPGAAASYNLFVARTGTTIAAGGNGTVGKGYVLLNSTVSVDAMVTAFFGRDAGVGAFYDQAALLNVTFSGAGMVGAGLWNVGTPPLSLADSSYVGWKSAGVTGLNVAALTTDPKTSPTIASQASEYDTRDHILNRVVTVTAGVPTAFQAAPTTWNVAPLATAWGAP